MWNTFVYSLEILLFLDSGIKQLMSLPVWKQFFQCLLIFLLTLGTTGLLQLEMCNLICFYATNVM
jgi:hypothetical protein